LWHHITHNTIAGFEYNASKTFPGTYSRLSLGLTVADLRDVAASDQGGQSSGEKNGDVHDDRLRAEKRLGVWFVVSFGGEKTLIASVIEEMWCKRVFEKNNSDDMISLHKLSMVGRGRKERRRGEKKRHE
jgi:hypothetical protein